MELPSLGRRGEGWVLIQGLLFVLIVAAGAVGPAWSGPARMVGLVVGVALILAGLALVLGGIAALRSQLTPLPRPVPGGRLIVDGVFGLVRHPIYGGGVLVALGWGLVMASPLALAGALGLALFVDLKARREEAWLEQEFAGYAAYRRGTRRLIPWIY
jgi:protein-S-isoprenylcysteine O-methyltransferase Ste14